MAVSRPGSGAGGFSPALDRRTLERLALGAPLPPPPVALRAIERGARIRRGWIARRISRAWHRSARGHVSPPPPRISIGGPLPRKRSDRDLSFEPLYLLIPGEESRRNGAGSAAAVAAAERFAGARPVVLIDLDAEHPGLTRQAGASGHEGIADALAFGVSLAAVGREVSRGVRLVGTGDAGSVVDLAAHPGWTRLVAAARRSGTRLLAYLPPDRARMAALAERAGAAMLLATPAEERQLRMAIPSSLPVVGVLAPPEAAATAAEAVAAAGIDETPRAESGADGTEAAAARTTAAPGSRRPAGEGLTAGMPAEAPRGETTPGREAAARSETGGGMFHGTTEPVRSKPENGVSDQSAGPAVGNAERGPETIAAPGTTGTAGADTTSGTVPSHGATATAGVGGATGTDSSRPAARTDGNAGAGGREGNDHSHGGNTISGTSGVDGTIDSRRTAGSDDASGVAPTTRTADSPGAPGIAAATGRTASGSAGAPAARSEAVPAAPHAGMRGMGAPRVDPPMQAPTARGLSLAGWLAEQEKRLREIEGAVLPTSPDPEDPALPGESDPSAPEGRRDTASAPPPAGAPESPRYSVPRLPEGRERLIRVAACLILAYWTYYISWRWLETLNLDALWFSIPLALAETWGWLTAFFLVFTVWRLNHRSPPPAPDGLSVDVFITTFDEPLEVIRRTAISAREIRYPHRTYVLDDGRRAEVRAMAAELGVGYLTRADNEHAKAGNLNHALGSTSGDFILQLDADHAPLPHILDRLLGFFDDERVAFVQTPQDFYNVDAFTSDVDEETQRIWEEQRLFFSVIQPGKDRCNSAFFCGSCAVIRRKALDGIGGFSTQTVTEDIETSLLLHAGGWKSVYLGESLAYGLAASSATAFHVQHRRWAQGAMQVLRRFNPLTLPGLAPAQRIGYFYSLSGYLVGLQKLIFYAAPIVFFLTGALPIRALDVPFLIRFVPYLLLSIALVEMLSRGLGFTWIAERYQMAKFWTYTRALAAYFTTRRLRFRVTPKGPGHVPLATYAPHLVLMVVTVASVYWATFAYARGWVDYAVPGWSSLAFQLNFLWAAINFVLAGYVVRLSVRLRHQRQDHRFSDRFPIHVQPHTPSGQLAEQQLALTENLNASGLCFRSVTRFEPGTELRIALPLSTSEVAVDGRVLHVRDDPDAEASAFFHGVAFRDVQLDVRDAIELHCAQHAAPFGQMQFRPTARALTRGGERPRQRGDRRRSVRLPAWVALGGGDADGGTGGRSDPLRNVAFLEEIGPGTASFIMSEAVPPGTPVVFEVPGAPIRGEGRITASLALETPIGVRFSVGVRTGSLGGGGDRGEGRRAFAVWPREGSRS